MCGWFVTLGLSQPFRVCGSTSINEKIEIIMISKVTSSLYFCD